MTQFVCSALDGWYCAVSSASTLRSLATSMRASALPLLLLAAAAVLLAISPAAAQTPTFISIFDGEPLVYTPTQQLSYFQFRMQSFKSVHGKHQKAPNAPSIPQLMVSYTNLTSGDATSSTLATLYGAVVGPPSPQNAQWSSTSGMIVLDAEVFEGWSYLFLIVDVGADNFVNGTSSFSIVASLFEPVDLSACVPQRWIVQNTPPTHAQFRIQSGPAPSSSPSQIVEPQQVSFELYALSPNPSFVLYATPSTGGSSNGGGGAAPGPSNFVWQSSASTTLVISGDSPSWPVSGQFVASVQGPDESQYFVVQGGGTACGNADKKNTVDEKDQGDRIAWA